MIASSGGSTINLSGLTFVISGATQNSLGLERVL